MNWRKILEDRLSPPNDATYPGEHGIAASVIIPIGRDKNTGTEQILMTKRTDLVQSHKNEVGFPGGVYDTSDKGNLLLTALREMEEEVGVPYQALEVLGLLSPVTTIGEILVFPFVAVMEFPFPYILNKQEVAKTLYVPLNQLMEEGLKPMEVPVGNKKVRSIGLFAEGERIWGASAMMLHELRELLLK